MSWLEHIPARPSLDQVISVFSEYWLTPKGAYCQSKGSDWSHLSQGHLSHTQRGQHSLPRTQRSLSRPRKCRSAAMAVAGCTGGKTSRLSFLASLCVGTSEGPRLSFLVLCHLVAFEAQWERRNRNHDNSSYVVPL